MSQRSSGRAPTDRPSASIPIAIPKRNRSQYRIHSRPADQDTEHSLYDPTDTFPRHSKWSDSSDGNCLDATSADLAGLSLEEEGLGRASQVEIVIGEEDHPIHLESNPRLINPIAAFRGPMRDPAMDNETWSDRMEKQLATIPTRVESAVPEEATGKYQMHNYVNWGVGESVHDALDRHEDEELSEWRKRVDAEGVMGADGTIDTEKLDRRFKYNSSTNDYDAMSKARSNLGRGSVQGD